MSSNRRTNSRDSVTVNGVSTIKPDDPVQLLECIRDTGKTGSVRCLVIDLEYAEFNPLDAGRSIGSLPVDYSTPVIAAASGRMVGWRSDAALLSHLCFADANTTFESIAVGLQLTREATHKDAEIGEGSRTAGQLAREGLINLTLTDDNAVAKAIDVATKVSMAAPLAVSACLKAVEYGIEKEISKGLRIERQLFADLFRTQDMRRGTRAFLEKRNPNFQGD